MGQQQLLLLVLGIVIVGIAIVVGINAYSENSVKSNWDALLQDALRVASDAQAWKGKPELFGGSPDANKTDSTNFLASDDNLVDFLDLGYASSKVDPADLYCYTNLNGVFNLTDGIVGTSAACTDGISIYGTNTNTVNEVVVYVCGTTEAQVELDNSTSIKGGAVVQDGSDGTLADPCG